MLKFHNRQGSQCAEKFFLPPFYGLFSSLFSLSGRWISRGTRTKSGQAEGLSYKNREAGEQRPASRFLRSHFRKELKLYRVRFQLSLGVAVRKGSIVILPDD
jgi:hypothetical protein